MATIKDRHSPEFIQFPCNNNRTAWRNFGIPNVLVVPHRRDITGSPIANSGVFSIRIYIEGVPQEARIAGPFHVGQRFPDHELYAVTLNSLGLADRQIAISDYPITRGGEPVEFSDAQSGDLITYTTSTGVRDTMPYLPDADYYDLSDLTLETESLPSDRYVMVYQADYYYRIISEDTLSEFLCIDVTRPARTQLRFMINHPGEVLDEIYHLTPPPYLTNELKSQDSTVALYRPFTDIFQDVMDEQDQLQKLNWVREAPPEAIPYLSALLGWDLPYFPQSVDTLRQAVLRRTVEFQNLVGSRRALINFFRLFGFEILITNLWWSSDGKRFIRPGDTLVAPYTDQSIQLTTNGQVDLLLNNWGEDGFGSFKIPLLFRPQQQASFDSFQAVRDGGNITIEAYTVEKDSEAHLALQQLANDILANPENYGAETGVTTDANEFLTSTAISEALDGKEVLGFSQILISGNLGQATQETLVGQKPPVKKVSTSYNQENNILSLTLNVRTEGNELIYAFAFYNRQVLIVPDIIKDLQSNRFEMQIITNPGDEFADPTTLEFVIEFIYRLKAFHSLLHVIRTRIELTEVYQVTDYCVGGDVIQRYDTDGGRLQVPPAIIPNLPSDITDCTKLDPISLEYKDSDLLLRERIIAALPEEHAAWKLLDTRIAGDTAGLGLSAPEPADRTSCLYNYRGQDRVSSSRVELRDIEAESFTREYADIRTPMCTLTGADYCYKGRVDDELSYQLAITVDEYPRQKACALGMGTGLYYTYPAISKPIIAGTAKPALGSKTAKTVFSGSATQVNERLYVTPVTEPYLTAGPGKLPAKNNSLLGKLYRDYGIPTDETLHFTNRHELVLTQRDHLALQRPNLVIEKPTMHLPGCRFISMASLASDFTHPTINARPWDDQYSTYCGPKNQSTEPTFLNCRLESDTDGNEVMVFDTVAFKITGNGLTPDVPSLGDHSGSSIASSNVIHAVFMNGANDSPYVTLDQVCDYDTSVDDDGTIAVVDPIFQSHGPCNTGEIRDFADGYVCSSGFQSYNGEDFSDYDAVLDGLEMPRLSDSTTDTSVLFNLGSGILNGTGLRFDCGCMVAGCSGTEITDTICNSDLFLDSEGNYDWNIDHVALLPVMTLVETVGTCSSLLDGSIPSLLETSG